MENEILLNYIAGETSLRDVAEKVGSNHHTVKRALLKNGIAVVRAKRKPFTDEHKERISEATKGRSSWAKGKKMRKDSLYKNMAAHLRFDVSFEWLLQFEDFEKLKLLNNVITNRAARWDVTTDWYKNYIETFYHQDQFNMLYSNWVNSNFERYKKPSVDHIIPVSKGGTNDLNNLQFLTWFENRCKNDMSQTEWDTLKKKIQEYLI